METQDAIIRQLGIIGDVMDNPGPPRGPRWMPAIQLESVEGHDGPGTCHAGTGTAPIRVRGVVGLKRGHYLLRPRGGPTRRLAPVPHGADSGERHHRQCPGAWDFRQLAVGECGHRRGARPAVQVNC